MLKDEFNPLSLVEYARISLASPKVKEILGALEASNRIVLSLEEVIKRESSSFISSFYQESLEGLRRSALSRIIDENVPQSWQLRAHNMKDIVSGRLLKQGGPIAEDVPLMIFWEMMVDVDFQPYLLTGKLPWFAAPLPTGERELQFVVALFLWFKMDVRIDRKRRVQYYEKALLNKNKLVYKDIEKDAASTVQDRRIFIETFGAYIHTDVWTADDYEEREKEGVIIRLRLSDHKTGQVVVQTCGAKARNCNALYLATELMTKELERIYLSNEANRPTRPLQCILCGNTATFVDPTRLMQLYCSLDCYGGK